MMMQVMRTKAGKILASFFALAFLGWMVLQVGLDINQSSYGGNGNEVGRVNGLPITIDQYNNAYQQLYDQVKQNRSDPLTADDQAQIRERVWQQLVDQALLQSEIDRRGIRISDGEIRQAALVMPPPEILQQELFQTNGQFDPRKYQQYLSGPSASPELFASLESYYRSQLPQQKLFRQVAAGFYLTDAQLWRTFRDQREAVTVEYVVLDLAKLAPGDAPVSDAEVKAYYEANRDDFKRSRSARFGVAYLPLTKTAADTAATLARAEAVRTEIAGGADFAVVARRESRDPASRAKGGDLGNFSRGQMVPAFDSAAFSLPVGQLSAPVLSPYGYHIIQVQSRTGDQVTARHILLPIEKSDAEQAKLDARADSLQKLAATIGLERAARLVGAAYRPNLTVNEAAPYAPGVGSMREALDWAEEQATASDAPARPVSDLLETREALYVAQLEAYTPKGTLTLAEAAPQIRRILTLEKKKAAARAEGRKMLAEVRAGATLQQAAAKRGLTVQTAGPFTRAQPNPAFGQANAVVGAAFGTPVGKVSDVVESAAGLFVVRPTQRTAPSRAEFAAQKEQLRQEAAQQLQQRALAQWLAGLRRTAKIQDFRDQVLRQRAS